MKIKINMQSTPTCLSWTGGVRVMRAARSPLISILNSYQNDNQKTMPNVSEQTFLVYELRLQCWRKRTTTSRMQQSGHGCAPGRTAGEAIREVYDTLVHIYNMDRGWGTAEPCRGLPPANGSSSASSTRIMEGHDGCSHLNQQQPHCASLRNDTVGAARSPRSTPSPPTTCHRSPSASFRPFRGQRGLVSSPMQPKSALD